MLATPTVFGGGLPAVKVAKAGKTVSIADAANSLRHFLRGGAAGIKPQDVEQQKAFIALRATQPRCSPQQFLDYFKSLQNVTTHGAGAKQVLWAVPKVNFPDGLPANIEKVRKDEANCEGFIVDHTDYWVIDQCITQSELGVDVFPIEKFLSTSISPAAEEASYPSPDANNEPSNYYPTTFQSPGGYFPDDSYRNYFSESSEDEYQPPCSKCHPAGPETLDMNIHYCLARQESDLQEQDPQDVEQQKAYIALRATQPRCTAKQFLDYSRGRSVNSLQSAASSRSGNSLQSAVSISQAIDQ